MDWINISKCFHVWYELASIKRAFSILISINDSVTTLLPKIWLFASDIILLSKPFVIKKSSDEFAPTKTP